jgi:hypothetical protein
MKLQLSNFYKWAIFLFMLLPAKLFAACTKAIRLKQSFCTNFGISNYYIGCMYSYIYQCIAKCCTISFKKTELKKMMQVI